MSISIPVAAIILGALLYFAANGKVSQAGLVLFACGVFWLIGRATGSAQLHL